MVELPLLLTAPSEAQQAQALERIAPVRPTLENGISQTTAHAHPSDLIVSGSMLDEVLSNSETGRSGRRNTLR